MFNQLTKINKPIFFKKTVLIVFVFILAFSIVNTSCATTDNGNNSNATTKVSVGYYKFQ